MPGNKTTKAARDRFYAERRRKIEQARAAVKARPRYQTLGEIQRAERAAAKKQRDAERQRLGPHHARLSYAIQTGDFSSFTTLDPLAEFITSYAFTEVSDKAQLAASLRYLQLRGL